MTNISIWGQRSPKIHANSLGWTVLWYGDTQGFIFQVWVCYEVVGEERSDAWPWGARNQHFFTKINIFPPSARPQLLPKKTASTVVFLWEGSPEGPLATALLSWRALGTWGSCSAW